MPIRSAVTISLVPAARGGPFVFWDDLEAGCRAAAALGFDAVEVFPPSPDAIAPATLRRLLDHHGLQLAAVGTGAGWVVRKLTLTDPDAGVRDRAQQFVRAIIDFAGAFGAPAIIGSIQGRFGGTLTREDGRAHVRDALCTLSEHADQYGTPLLYEPLNRYETNLANTVAEGVALLDTAGAGNVRLLADLFHMNIEETDIAAAIRSGAGRIGHIHFVDSNRRAVGFGHIEFPPIVAAIRAIGYDGYLSAEALPLPSSEAAARQTIESFRRFLGPSAA